MAHILVGYELGGGHGHVHRLMPLVRALEQRGHRVTFFLRNIRENAGLLSRERRAVLPVPGLVARIPRAPVPAPPAAYSVQDGRTAWRARGWPSREVSGVAVIFRINKKRQTR